MPAIIFRCEKKSTFSGFIIMKLTASFNSQSFSFILIFFRRPSGHQTIGPKWRAVEEKASSAPNKIELELKFKWPERHQKAGDGEESRSRTAEAARPCLYIIYFNDCDYPERKPANPSSTGRNTVFLFFVPRSSSLSPKELSPKAC